MNYLTKEQGNKVVIGLVNDPTITDEYWEEKVQHIRDDFCLHIRKYDCVKTDELVDFHGECIYEIIKKYLGDENMLNKAEEILDNIVNNFASVGKIGSHYEDDGSVTIMLSNEEVEFKNNDFEYNIEMILYQLSFQLNEGVNFSHKYIIDEDDEEEDTPNMCNINLKIVEE